METMESPPKSDWKLSLRTVVFGGLIALSLLAVVTGEFSPAMVKLPQQAEMLRRGGDTFMRLYYLAGDANWRPEDTRPFLGTAAEFYSRAAQLEPGNYQANLRVAFTLHLLGFDTEAQTFLFPKAEFSVTESERGALPGIYDMMLKEKPSDAAIDSAKDFVLTLAPGPAILADSYRRTDMPKLAQETIAAAAAQSRPILRALLAVVVANGLIVLSGVWLAAWSLVKLRRGTLSRATAEGQKLPTRAVGLREVAEALILWLFLSAVFARLMSSSAWVKGLPSLIMLAPPLAAELVAIGWVGAATGFRARFGWNLKQAGRNVALGAAAAGAAVLPALGVYALFQNLMHRSAADDPLLPLLLSPKGIWAKVLIVAVVGLIGPALEETLFRGVLFGGLRRQWSFWPAAAASAAVFALVHMSLPGFASYALLGFVFAAVYEWRGSLVAPWAAHAVFNLFNLIVLFSLFG